MKSNLLFFTRLLLRHIWLLITVPVVLAVFVFYLTRNQPKKYSSSTEIYTGIVSGSSIDVADNQRNDFYTNKTAFDNLINIIQSRKTIEEVGLELFTKQMLLDKPDPHIISDENYRQLMQIVPDSVKQLVVKDNFQKTLDNFTKFKNQNDRNFIYRLLNLSNPDYSVDEILSRIDVERVSTSDLLKISYTSEDPGICQTTLDILCHVFIRSYAQLEVNQSDAVVGYFKTQLDTANNRLANAEDELLHFKQKNNIIDFDEQIKDIASQKDNLDTEYQATEMKFEAAKSVVRFLESRMNSQQKRQITSRAVLRIRDEMAAVNMKLASVNLNNQLDSTNASNSGEKLAELRSQADKLNIQLKASVDTLYHLDNSKEGVPTESLLDDWLQNVMDYETSKAQLEILNKRKAEFNNIYARYAPLGATMKKLERKIDIAEKRYFSLLNSLSTAKLKQQNVELTSNLKILDSPYYPIKPESSKRILLVVLAGMLGFIFVAFAILALEFLDSSIKIVSRAENIIGLKVASIFPKIDLRNKKIDFAYLKERAIDAIARHVIFTSGQKSTDAPGYTLNVLCSAQQQEGKSYLGRLLASRLVSLGYKVLILNHDRNEGEALDNFSAASYQPNEQFYRVDSLEELLPNDFAGRLNDFDFIFLEIPGILENPFPVELIQKADHIYLVCRANRSWSEADRNIVTNFRSVTEKPEPVILLNGVELNEMENVLGEIPRKRSRLRRMLKNLIQFRFFSKNNIVS